MTRDHRKNAGRLLAVIKARGPMTLNEMAEALGLPISSACSLRDCIDAELVEVDTVPVIWPSGRSTQRTRWRAR